MLLLKQFVICHAVAREQWAEVLSADAFGAFEEAGLMEQGLEHVVPVGRRFRHTVLVRRSLRLYLEHS